MHKDLRKESELTAETLQPETSKGDGDLASIEKAMEKLRAKGGIGDDAYYKVFEDYKAAVGREMLKMKKNLNIMRQENDNLKSSNLEMKRKHETIDKLKRQIEEIDEDHAILKNSMKYHERSFG